MIDVNCPLGIVNERLSKIDILPSSVSKNFDTLLILIIVMILFVKIKILFADKHIVF
jgi:hypothetical protein